jgi:hypothetical protein
MFLAAAMQSPFSLGNSATHCIAYSRTRQDTQILSTADYNLFCSKNKLFLTEQILRIRM